MTSGFKNKHLFKEYFCWSSMKRRCKSPKHPDYAYYGGRGIKVCSEWEKFSNFIRDMGPAPSKTHSLDRIDNNGNYEPKNCKWATKEEQTRNRRIRKDSKSGIQNISYNSQSNKWVVSKRINGKCKYFGQYDSIELAKKALSLLDNK